MADTEALDWSAKQGRILTGDGRLNDLYQAPRFPFTQDELPHYHLANGTSHETFARWQREGRGDALVVGAWTRPLFTGGWEHSENATGERVVNVQTPSLFVDMRLPLAARDRFRGHTSLQTLSVSELRLFARRHVFAGYSLISKDHTDGEPVCVRHHVIDWNYVGALRPRPNKWRIEMHPRRHVWKEWGFARDRHGQHVYLERWERLPAGDGPCFAMRRQAAAAVDAILVVCGQHFALVENRPVAVVKALQLQPGDGLVSVVDRLLGTSSLVTPETRHVVESLLSLRGVYGSTADWRIAAAIHPWEEGRPLLQPGDVAFLASSVGAVVQWGEYTWDVLENTDPAYFRALLATGVSLAKL